MMMAMVMMASVAVVTVMANQNDWGVKNKYPPLSSKFPFEHFLSRINHGAPLRVRFKI
jgi:hypothetical protein